MAGLRGCRAAGLSGARMSMSEPTRHGNRARLEARRLDGEPRRLAFAALQAAVDGVVITDRDGVVEWSNGAFSQITGYTLEEIRGRNLRLLKSGKQDSGFYERLWKTILAGCAWTGQMINRRK